METIHRLLCGIWIICILMLMGCGNNTSESMVEENNNKNTNITPNVIEKRPNIQDEHEEPKVQGDMLNETNHLIDEENVDNEIVLQDMFVIQGRHCCLKVFEESESEYQYLLEITDEKGEKCELKSIISADEFVEENMVDRVQFEDVNFDGEEDVLIWIGLTGSKGNLRYDCFLKKGMQYLYCEGFSDIFNPYVDKDAKAVVSTVVNADSYYEIKYSICEEHVELVDTDEYLFNSDTGEYELK